MFPSSYEPPVAKNNICLIPEPTSEGGCSKTSNVYNYDLFWRGPHIDSVRNKYSIFQ